MSLVPYKVTAITKTDPTGNNVLPMASVAIVKSGGGYAQLWDDEAGTTPRGNPFQVDANGERQVWLNGGEYNVSVAGGQSWEIRLSGAYNIQSVATIADLRGLEPTVEGQECSILGHTVAGKGSGVFYYDAADTTSSDNNGTIIVTAAGKRWKRKGASSVSVFDFGALGNGVVDDTLAAQSALDYFKSLLNSQATREITFPSGTYRIRSLRTTDLYNCVINLSGALILGNATSPEQALLEVYNYSDVQVVGGSISSFDNPNYARGIWMHGGPGGTISPVDGLGNQLSLTRVNISRFREGLKIGNELLDVNLGQTNLVGCQIVRCDTALHGAGSQTIITAAGCCFTCGNVTAFGTTDIDKSAVKTSGAVISISASEVDKTGGIGYGVILTNSASPAYGYPYGSVTIHGGLMECTTLARIKRSYGAATVASANSCLTLHGVSGYISSLTRNQIRVEDPDYVGTVTCTDGNLYSGGGLRSVHTIYCAIGSRCIIKTDKNTWRAGSNNWLSDISGGIVRLENETIVHVENLAGLSFAALESKNLIYVGKTTSGQYARYAGTYNSSTGVLTVPTGGFKAITIDVSATSVSFGSDGVVDVRKNGVTVYKHYPNTRIAFSTTLINLEEGDTIEIYASKGTGGTTFATSAVDFMTVRATV